MKQGKLGYNTGDAAIYKAGGLSIGGGLLEWWDHAYVIIRKLNEFLQRLPSSPIDENLKDQRMAEARFLRAFNYFAMVKRYGAVPLITVLRNWMIRKKNCMLNVLQRRRYMISYSLK